MRIQVSTENPEAVHDFIRNLYGHGGSALFAIALHKETDWPLWGRFSQDGELLHAGVKTPAGDFLDVFGQHEEGAFGTNSPQANGSVLREVTETELQERCQADGKAVLRAIVHAQCLYSNLPNTGLLKDRIGLFLSDLEEVCRKHGFYIRPDGPHGIHLYEAYGNEDGFSATFHPTGTITIDRVLGPDPEDNPSPRL